MEKVIIGERLSKRIKDMGYTQQAFADLMGMKIDTLHSYISGRSAYSYELLIEFAEKLGCSYDYLLGYSLSPKREYHEITEQTRLSEKAIEKIVSYAKFYNEDFNAKRFIMCLDTLLCYEGAFSSICDFMLASKHTQTLYKNVIESAQNKLRENLTTKNIPFEEDKRMTLETQHMLHMVSMLKDMKASMSQELIAEIKALDTQEFFEKEDRELEAEIRKLTES